MKPSEKTTFALFFGNRGFFPSSLQEAARRELQETLESRGHKVLMLDASATRHGAVETPAEGSVYAEFLRRHRGQYDGVILCLPNFGDETGAVTALKDAGVPILIQAYPDELDKMGPALRRDAFCGKFSIMDVFCQYDVKFTALKPHTTSPTGPAFAANLDHFDRICRVVRGMKNLVVGAIGARTTAFKTVRIDELALQRHGITMETIDLSDVFRRMEALAADGAEVRVKTERLRAYTGWEGVPPTALHNLARMGVVLDQIVAELGLDALALRCWLEIQQQWGVSPCVLLSEMNDRGLAAACEVDVGNAVAMHALRLASGRPAMCLDWNNNYGDQDDKCIVFHCGPVPQSLMSGKGQIADHAILANVLGKGCSWGCNTGRIAPGEFTFASMLTRDGRLSFYLGEGRFTNDPIAEDFFGCPGVAQIAGLQDVLQTIGYAGHRHHVSVTAGHVAPAVLDAFRGYLGYDVTSV
jgi:L-fucose isomerase-like protein